jgi:hypothetical protein
MSVPRNTTDYTDINPKTQLPFTIDNSTITYDKTKVGGSTQVKRAVKISGDGIVACVADAEGIDGQLILVEADGKCTVRTTGSFKFPAGTGATFTAGRGVVGALGASSAPGFVRGVNVATQAEEDVEFGSVVDDSVSTAIVVLSS